VSYHRPPTHSERHFLVAPFRFEQSPSIEGLISNQLEEITVNIKSLSRRAVVLRSLLALGAIVLAGSAWGWLSESKARGGGPADEVKAALAVLTPDGLLEHIKVHSSDLYEGRRSATAGEGRTSAYLVGKFKELGPAPGNPDGGSTQDVPLVGFTAKPQIECTARGEKLDFAFPKGVAIMSPRFVPDVKQPDTDVVFVGYGIVAPEYQWEVYKDVNVRGKTILMLVNDPPIRDPKDPGKLNETMFKGKAITISA
jgi:hypothetical protein